MKIQIYIGEMLEQMNMPQANSQQPAGLTLNKLVNPTLFYKLPFIPGSLDLAVIVATYGVDTSVNHTTRLLIRKSGNPEPIAITDVIPLPANFLPGNEGINLNLEFKKVIIRDEGEYEVVFVFDDDEHALEFTIKGNEILQSRVE